MSICLRIALFTLFAAALLPGSALSASVLDTPWTESESRLGYLTPATSYQKAIAVHALEIEQAMPRSIVAPTSTLPPGMLLRVMNAAEPQEESLRGLSGSFVHTR